jgi:IclR family transcriptional regulator, pca regulon regulatory protein
MDAIIDPRQFVESLGRGFKLLTIVCQSALPLGLSELAKECNLSISTIQRLCYTLQQLGLLDRDPRTKKFKAGPEMITLSFAVIDNLTLKKVAYPHMQKLSEQIGEAVALAVISGLQVIIIEAVKTQQILNVNTSSGVSIPFHNTASGKSILAFLPESEADAILKQTELNKVTKNTITSINTFKAQLLKVKKCGFATAIDENAIGLGAVAAPIRGNDGEVLAALTVLVPTARVSKDKLIDVYSQKVVETAEHISFDMGYRKKTI